MGTGTAAAAATEYTPVLLQDFIHTLIGVVTFPPVPLQRYASESQKPHQVRSRCDFTCISIPLRLGMFTILGNKWITP